MERAICCYTYSFFHMQISALTKQNKLLTKKNSRTKDSASNKSLKETAGNKFGIHTTPEETLTGSAITHIKVGNSAAAASSSETCMETTLSSDEGQLEPVRTIEATQLNFKYLFMAILILLVSIFAIYLFQLE
ncbi:uncharacterized protein A4U43_C03F31900 [Asparagus officinalis]|uniref:Uncharacterized protein n=1 Tax=Asparagus officinalis TaxID=4686 RepID=A0A5P1FEH3_ASPOF|nr:uncharacterized protein LOC109835773 [Asparagus officinalis]ONK76765.1 uncharacterized protein A4U43_C03F31900 [Asparagus officinalis]